MGQEAKVARLTVTEGETDPVALAEQHQDRVVALDHTVAGQVRRFISGFGNHLTIQEGLFKNFQEIPLEPLAQFVSYGAMADPILLTQRTYNL